MKTREFSNFSRTGEGSKERTAVGLVSDQFDPPVKCSPGIWARLPNDLLNKVLINSASETGLKFPNFLRPRQGI